LYPVARKFLIDVEKEVETGKQQGFTGRIRHYFTHAKNMVDERTWEEGVSPLKRESKNFYLQHSVASVAAIATRRIQEEYEQLGMGSRVIAQLYDAVITLAPIPEREEVKRIHEDWLFRKTCQIYHGRELHYPVDHKVSDCWSFEDDLELCKSFHS
jgi:DNA polymerase I-like protein with 3'-5' exonuclease and polymerase domains